MLEASEALRDASALRTSCFGTTAYALNPLVYAWDVHRRYVQRYAPSRCDAIWVGMNPGPWGMMQTGVPFGAIPAVRDYLGIVGEVLQPPATHPKRPVEGFATTRVEVSGARLWGAIEARVGEPDAFFARTWIVNYCPVVWQADSGANVPPDKLPSAETEALFAVCDAHLATVIRILQPKTVIGVGVWAERRAVKVKEAYELSVRTGRILHPSPASPLANRDWAGNAAAQLEALGHPLSRA